MSACLARGASTAAGLVCLLAPAALATAALADDRSSRLTFVLIQDRPADQAAGPSAQDGAFVAGQDWPFGAGHADLAADRRESGGPDSRGDLGTKTERLQAMLQLAALWRF